MTTFYDVPLCESCRDAIRDNIGKPDRPPWRSLLCEDCLALLPACPRCNGEKVIRFPMDSTFRDEPCPVCQPKKRLEPDPDRPGVVATHGIDPAYKNAGAPKPIDPATGMHESYWVLSDEERAKGFVRPVRRSYKHVGVRPKHPTRPLTEEELERFRHLGYVAFEAYPDSEKTAQTGRYWAEAQLNSGCGDVTTMSQDLAESYARDISFYGATFCATCKEHYPVGAHGEFVWNGTDEKVGT